MATQKAWQVDRETYERVCFDHFCKPAIEIDATDRELMKLVDSEGGLKRVGENVTFPPCPIGLKQWQRLKRAGLVESRGFGFRLTMKGSLQVMMFDGINPWLGGPLKSHRRVVEEAVAAGHAVPESVLAEYGLVQLN